MVVENILRPKEELRDLNWREDVLDFRDQLISFIQLSEDLLPGLHKILDDLLKVLLPFEDGLPALHHLDCLDVINVQFSLRFLPERTLLGSL